MKRLLLSDASEIMDGREYIFSMANLETEVHGESFTFWMDEAGKGRNVGHNLIRFKADSGNKDSEVILILPRDGSTPYIDVAHTSRNNLSKFKHEPQVVRFMTEFRSILLAQWDGIISASNVSNIVKLVRRRRIPLESAINDVLLQSIYCDLHIDMITISESGDYWSDAIKRACHYNTIEEIEPDKTIVLYAKNLIKSIPDSRWSAFEDGNMKHRLEYSIAKYDKIVAYFG